VSAAATSSHGPPRARRRAGPWASAALALVRVALVLPHVALFALVGALTMPPHGAKALLARAPGAAGLARRWREASDAVWARLGRKLLADERDWPMLPPLFAMTAGATASCALQFACPGVHWALLGALHLAVLLGPRSRRYTQFFGIKHCEAHRRRGLFAPPWARLLGRHTEGFLGLLYGNIYGLDYVYHVRGHHAEGGGEGDRQTTLGFDRTSAYHFFRYVGIRHLPTTLGVLPLVYLWRKGKKKDFAKLLAGATAYYAYAGAACWLNWRAALFVVVLPLFINNLFGALGTWLSHAFHDPGAPDTPLYNTLTLIFDTDFLNEGYHLAHHQRPGCHWTELGTSFRAWCGRHTGAEPIVIVGVDWLDLWLLLYVRRRYDLLAQCWQPLRADHASYGSEERIRYLKYRLGRRLPAKAEGLAASSLHPPAPTPMKNLALRPPVGAPLAIRCSVLDQMVGRLAVPVVFFFDRRLDAASLARGLERALAVAPPFAGRLAAVGGALHIHCEGQGVPFRVARSERTLIEAIASVVEDRGGWLIDPVAPARALRGRAPLFTARVTHLADGATALGCCWHHAVGDMHSFMLFVKAWCAAVAGETAPVPLVVEDRAAYLDERVPHGGAAAPGLRRLRAAEIARLAWYLAFEARQKRGLQFYFGEHEITRMCEAYGGRDARVSANDALCAHLADAIGASDPRVPRRRLSIAVNFRGRSGLDPHVLGNMVTSVGIGVKRGEAPAAIAQRLRGALDRFDEDHLDYHATRRFVDAAGAHAFSRCLATWIDPLGRHQVVTNWSKFGVYDVRFEGERPVYFAPIAHTPIPWLGAIVEGFGSRGRIITTALPNEVADALRAPAALERLHRFREPSDPLPELLGRVPGVR
jgi:hypothetical protein